jgi:membrane-bound lytic murein transglycosylase MltF
MISWKKLLIILTFFNSGWANALPNGQNTHRLWGEFQSKPIAASLVVPYDHCFDRSARKYNLPKSLLLAVARGESDFNRKAVSKANARGVMQINPITARHLGIKHKHLFNACKNIDAGTRYLKQLYRQYNNWYMVLAAYNYGPGRIDKKAHFSTIPDGAQWYASYIYDHLTFVTTATDLKYDRIRKYSLITYNRPYRAKSYIEYLRKQLPDLHFSWFKKPFDKFEIVVMVGSENQRRRAAKQLKSLGMEI